MLHTEFCSTDMRRAIRTSGCDDGGKCPTQMESGRGQYVFDDAGAKYLDCVNSAAQVGHCAPSVVSATREAIERLSDEFETRSEGPAELERLLSLTLPPHLDCFLFCDSGSEAIDLAVRLARLWHCSSSRLPVSARRHLTASKSHKDSSKIWKTSTNVSDGNNCQSDSLLNPDISHRPYAVCDDVKYSSYDASGTSSKYNDEMQEANVSEPIKSSYCKRPHCESSCNGHQSLQCTSKPCVDSGVAFDDPVASASTYEMDDYRTRRDHTSGAHSSYTSCDSDFTSVSSGFTSDSGFFSSGVSGSSSATDGSSALCLLGDIAVVKGSFHGCTESLLNLSSRMESSSTAESSPSVVVIPLPDMSRVPREDTGSSDPVHSQEEKAVAHYLHATKKVLQDALKDGTRIAGFLCEPLLTIQGLQQPPVSWLQGVYRLMREHCGALCISDEIQCGLGRLGDNMWGFQALEVEPDIVVAGKGLGNGFPMAVTITSQEIAAKLGHMREAYRCSGVQSAVGSAVLDSLNRDQLLKGSSDTGRHLTRLLQKLKQKHSCVGAVRGRGLMHAIELVWNNRGSDPAPALAEFLIVKLRRVGVVIAREGIHLNVLLIMPPLTFDELDSATLVAKLDEALSLVPYNFRLESKERKTSRRYEIDPSTDAGHRVPGPSPTKDVPSTSEHESAITIAGRFQPPSNSGYPSSRPQHLTSHCVIPSGPHSNYPMQGEPNYIPLQSNLCRISDKSARQSKSRARDSENFSTACSSSATNFPERRGQEGTTQENYRRHLDSATRNYESSRDYQQNFPVDTAYSSTSFANIPTSGVSANCNEARTLTYQSSYLMPSQSTFGVQDFIQRSEVPTSDSSVPSYREVSHNLASPERNFTTKLNGSKSKLSKKSSSNKKGKPDLFSNIDFEVRDNVPPVADVLSGVPGIMQSGSTFVNPPVEGRGSRASSSRTGSSSRATLNQEVRSSLSTRPSTSSEGVPFPIKNECLHPDETPRGCCITNVGLGMMPLLLLKRSSLDSHRLADYEGID